MEPSREKILQNLKDCDCDEGIIRCIMDAVDADRTGQALELLAKHRQELLDRFHRSKSCIDCLDYLVYQMEKEPKEKE